MARTNFGIGSVGVPSNLYSGGAVVFNSQPYINYYLNQQAHKQAQEDSFYRYFGELGKSLTPSGMHTKDIPGLMQRKNDWQQYMMENRKAIARPGLDQGRAYSESMRRYNDMIGYINQSKNDVKNIASIKPILDSPQKKALLNDTTQARLHYGSLPIDHPDYHPFDPSTIDYNPPPFDAKQANALRLNISQYKPSDSPTIHPIGNNQQQIVHNYRFNKNDLNGIYSQGATAYHTNPSFRGTIDEVQNNPALHNSLNQVFNEHYGRDMYSAEDAATAYMLTLHPDISNKVETKNIPINPWENMHARVAGEKEFYDYRKQREFEKATESSDEADKFLSNRETEAKQGGTHPYIHGQTGVRENAYDLQFTPDQVKKIFSTRDISGKHTLIPDKVQLLESGKYLPVYYEYDDKGQPVSSPDGTIAVDKRYTKPVSREAVRESILANKIIPKSTKTITKETTGHTTSTTKKYTFGSGGLN